MTNAELYAEKCKALLESCGPGAVSRFSTEEGRSALQTAVEADLKCMVDMSEQHQVAAHGVGRRLAPRPTLQCMNPGAQPVALLKHVLAAPESLDYMTTYPFDTAVGPAVLASWMAVVGESVFDLFLQHHTLDAKVIHHRGIVRERILRNFNQQKVREAKRREAQPDGNTKRREAQPDVNTKRREAQLENNAKRGVKRAPEDLPAQRQARKKRVVANDQSEESRRDMRPMGICQLPVGLAREIIGIEAEDQFFTEVFGEVGGDMLPPVPKSSPVKGAPPEVCVVRTDELSRPSVFASPPKRHQTLRVYNKDTQRPPAAVAVMSMLFVPNTSASSQ